MRGGIFQFIPVPFLRQVATVAFAEEIGTADFDTLAQQLHGTEGVAGLSVEPVEVGIQWVPEIIEFIN